MKEDIKVDEKVLKEYEQFIKNLALPPDMRDFLKFKDNCHE